MTRRRTLLTETALVLGVSLGASAIWAVLRIIERLTRAEALGSQTAAMNSSVTPDRPWLDLTYQLTGIALALVPVALALFLLAAHPGPPPPGSAPDTAPLSAPERSASGEPTAYARVRRVLGLDATRPLRDLALGCALAAAVGIPGLGLYAAAKALGLNTTVAAANLAGAWWTIPVLVLAAAQNAVLEEVLMVGYLFRRWQQAGLAPWLVIVVSAVIRGSYHLYQGFGGFAGNLAMGLIFGWLYQHTRRLWPLVIAHTLLDIVAFVGYTVLQDHLTWL